MASLKYEREILNLESASTNEYIESVTILLKILDNVIREPHNNKYRTIRLENKIIKEKLLCLSGVRQLLEKIGFIEVRFHSLKLPKMTKTLLLKCYQKLKIIR